MVVATTLDRPGRAAHAHSTLLRPLLGSTSTSHETGMVLSATEQSFVDALLQDLASSDWRTRLASRLPARFGSDNVMELSQPTHRRYHLVVLEAACEMPGSPRLDPDRIDSMGLVIRRGANDGAAGAPWQGWMTDGRRKLGWQPLPRPSAIEAARHMDPDPDPVRRPLRRSFGLGTLDARVADAVLPPAEDVLPLFMAPTSHCVALGRTVLFGLVPLASSELSEGAPPSPDYVSESQNDGGALVGHLSGYLKARPRTALPRAGHALDATWFDVAPDSSADSEAGHLLALAVLLQQLTAECDAFGSGDAAQELLRLFAQIQLPTATDANGNVTASITAAEFLRKAAAVLAGDDMSKDVVMPKEWPAVGDELGAQLTRAALTCMSTRFARIKPGIGKFDGLTRQYALRAFIRVKEDAACPPRLVWSNWSSPFRILPWWDGDAPPVQVPLPDISDRNVLKAMKPGVAFQMPASLADLLRGDPKKLRDGTPGGGGELGLAWLCSFSIPLITICAFIVLNIFLSLFDLFFRWMMFIKICIPVPKRGAD
jgi:hypothetical protein